MPAASSTSSSTVFGSRSLNFAHASGSYTQAEAIQDFGNMQSGWNESRATITRNQCQVKLLKNSLSSASGMIAKYDVPAGTSYSTTFSVKFAPNFEWATGGKLGPGFFIGDGAAGGSGTDGLGGSARLVWHKHPSSGEVYLQAYAYYADQQAQYGDTFGRYPAVGSTLAQNTWYKVKLDVKSNSGSNADGMLALTINGQTIVNQTMRWTTNDAKKFVNQMQFATFRGGATPDYMSSTDSYVAYSNLSWTRLAA